MLAASLPYSESIHVILISCKNYLHGNTSMGVRPINWSSEPVKATHKINLVFPVVMYGWESWTIKKAEHQIVMLLNCGGGEDS